MKYTIETTKNGCVETIELKNGRKYTKRHTKISFGLTCVDDEFAQQMEADGIIDEILDDVYETFDAFLALNFMNIARLEMY